MDIGKPCGNISVGIQMVNSMRIAVECRDCNNSVGTVQNIAAYRKNHFNTIIFAFLTPSITLELYLGFG